MLVAYDSHYKHPCPLSKIFPHGKIKKDPKILFLKALDSVWQSSHLRFNWKLCFAPAGFCFSIFQRWKFFFLFLVSIVSPLFFFFFSRSSQEAIGFPATLSHLRHISQPRIRATKTRNIGVGSTGSSKGRAFFSRPRPAPAGFVAATHMELLARKRVWVPCAHGQETLMRWWSDPRFVLSCWSRCGTKRRVKKGLQKIKILSVCRFREISWFQARFWTWYMYTWTRIDQARFPYMSVAAWAYM